MARIDLSVDLRRAGDDVETVDVAGVQPLPFDCHGAAIDLITIQVAVIEDRFTGAQRDARRVDKTAAITGNTVGVGHDHLGRLPRHFGIAAQLARAATADFVENDVGCVAMQVWIAKDDAA